MLSVVQMAHIVPGVLYIAEVFFGITGRWALQ